MFCPDDAARCRTTYPHEDGAMLTEPERGAKPSIQSEIEHFQRFGRLRFPLKGGEGDPPNPDPAKPKPDDDFPADLGEAGKKALKAERDRAAAAERALKEANDEREALRKEKADAAAAKAAADEEEARKKGEFEALANKHKGEAETAKGEAKTTAEKLARAETLLKSVIADRVKQLEELGDRELFEAFPKDADPLAQIEWLDDPRTKSAIKAAGDSKKGGDPNPRQRVPQTPPKQPGDRNERQIDQDRVRQRAQRAYSG